MARPRLDKDKQKNITSIRIDNEDREGLTEDFGNMQRGFDILIMIYNGMTQSEKEKHSQELESRRNQK